MLMGTLRCAAAKLYPCVSGLLRIASHQQVPLDAFRLVAIRLHAMRGCIAFEQKRKLKGENA